ncbi:MAG: AbrB/MazE/SpoVT family DNA-binding domain-containing protein [Dehalococcoidia bacterium]
MKSQSHHDMKARIDKSGQITIPQTLRDALGWHGRTLVEFSQEEGRLVITKAPDEYPLEKWFGYLDSDQTVDEMIEEMRGPVDAVDP